MKRHGESQHGRVNTCEQMRALIMTETNNKRKMNKFYHKHLKMWCTYTMWLCFLRHILDLNTFCATDCIPAMSWDKKGNATETPAHFMFYIFFSCYAACVWDADLFKSMHHVSAFSSPYYVSHRPHRRRRHWCVGACAESSIQAFYRSTLKLPLPSHPLRANRMGRRQKPSSCLPLRLRLLAQSRRKLQVLRSPTGHFARTQVNTWNKKKIQFFSELNENVI